MSDIECPYCGGAQEICHDDGYGYAEDEEHEQECHWCKKVFKYTTSISYFYEAYCQDGEHDMEAWEKRPGMWVCKNCEYCERRPEPPTEGE